METLFLGKYHVYVGEDNYLYVCSRKHAGTTYYRCRRKDCYGRVNVKAGRPQVMTTFHNHECDIQEVEYLRFKSRLQHRAANEHTSLSQIYREESEQYKNGKKPLSTASMYRARNSAMPPSPTTISQILQTYADDRWSNKVDIYSLDEEKTEFFRTILESDDNSQLAIFVSSTFEHYAKLGELVRLHVDTTFKAIPQFESPSKESGFLIIYLYIGPTVYPLLHALMNKKTYRGYISIMKYLKQLTPHVASILTNEDDLIQRAACKVFPNATVSTDQKQRSSVEIYHKELISRAGKPYPNVWRFIEVLKEKEFDKICQFMNALNRIAPRRRNHTDVAIQVSPKMLDTPIQLTTINTPLEKIKTEAVTDVLDNKAIKISLPSQQQKIETCQTKTYEIKAIDKAKVPDNVRNFFSHFKEEVPRTEKRIKISVINKLVKTPLVHAKTHGIVTKVNLSSILKNKIKPELLIDPKTYPLDTFIKESKAETWKEERQDFTRGKIKIKSIKRLVAKKSYPRSVQTLSSLCRKTLFPDHDYT